MDTSIDDIIRANNDTNRKRMTITPEQLKVIKEVIAKMEAESGQPVCWHELSKELDLGGYEEMKG